MELITTCAYRSVPLSDSNHPLRPPCALHGAGRALHRSPLALVPRVRAPACRGLRTTHDGASRPAPSPRPSYRWLVLGGGEGHLAGSLAFRCHPHLLRRFTHLHRRPPFLTAWLICLHSQEVRTGSLIATTVTAGTTLRTSCHCFLSGVVYPVFEVMSWDTSSAWLFWRCSYSKRFRTSSRKLCRTSIATENVAFHLTGCAA
jgi:hypothetical protein